MIHDIIMNNDRMLLQTESIQISDCVLKIYHSRAFALILIIGLVPGYWQILIATKQEVSS
jgi:hypothetical protein